MTKTKVTVIVVNYNSEAKWSIIGSCLKGILSLSYRPLEIIIVDNGSADKSLELIKQLVSEVKQSQDFNVRIIKLSKNYGFAIANIIAYKFRDPASKYIALINNDAFPEANSLEKLVEALERNERIAGVQGAILAWDGSYILTYGGFVTDHGLLRGGIAAFMESSVVNKLKPIAVTYVDGAYSVYRIEALEKAGGLFMPYFFMWGDDYELGIRLWRAGYILLAIPLVVAKHYAGASAQLNRPNTPYEPPKLSYIYEYWRWVSDIAIVVLYGSPYILQLLKRLPTTLIVTALKRSKAIVRGFVDGTRLGVKLRRKVVKLNSWLIIPKEPRFATGLFLELTFLIYLYLRYGHKASRVYYILTGRALLKKYGISNI
jgi:GT2 family glycosyltransferase